MDTSILDGIRRRMAGKPPVTIDLSGSPDLDLRAAIQDAIKLSDESRQPYDITTQPISEGTMKAGVILFVVSDVKDFMVSQSLMTQDGSFNDLTLDQWLAIAGVVEKSLQSHGITVPSEIDAAMSAFPLLAALITKLRK